MKIKKKKKKKKKKMTLEWVVNGETTPRWAAGGVDPPRPLDQIKRRRRP